MLHLMEYFGLIKEHYETSLQVYRESQESLEN